MCLFISVTYDELLSRLGDVRATTMRDIDASLNQSFVLSGVSDDVGGGYGCFIFAPNSAPPGGCTPGFMTFDESDAPTNGNEEWMDLPCFSGISTNRPDGEWQYRFYAPSQGDCGIEVKSAFVADHGDWNIVMGANNDQFTLYSVNIDGEHSF